MNIKLLAFVGLLAATIAVGSLAAPDVARPEETEEKAITARDKFQLPKLFNFDYFKQIFTKHYANFAEEMRRQKLFLGQAFRAFLSGISYKHKISSYYLAVNHLSDWTPKEIDNLQSNVVITEDMKERVVDRSSGKIVSEQPIAADVKTIEEQLEDIKQRSSEPGYDIIAKGIQELEKSLPEHQRRKRDTDSGTLRDFSMDKLIKDKPVKVSEEVLKKIDMNPKSNNPDYEAPEVTSCGVMDNIVMPNLEGFNPWNSLNNLKNLVSSAASTLINDFQNYAEEEVGKPDEAFIDHRESNCMNAVQDQGSCGSCYAFSANAYFEFYFCKETGKLLKFSEQYVMDCANQIHRVFKGCSGGSSRTVGEFYHHAGIELEKNYPYRARNGTCPYRDVKLFDPETAPGFFRLKNADQLIGIKLKYAHEYLVDGPLMVAIGTQANYASYGGGVHDGEGCCGPENDTDNCGGHAQLLIGHGVEDGVEYWLMRNSYGTDWGEEGYYKLSKKSDCIHPRTAWKLGAVELDSPVDISPRVNMNHRAYRAGRF